MKSILTFTYICVCISLIILVFLQNSKSSQLGLGGPSQVSRTLFGSSGSKGFFYTLTKGFIAAFFLLALSHTVMDYRAQQRSASSFSSLPLEQFAPLEK
jgi:protein translocase SecG subunit